MPDPELEQIKLTDTPIRIYKRIWQRQRSLLSSKTFGDERREKKRISEKKLRQKRRLQILIHYGGDPPKCSCCDETEIKFLSIDHIKGGGNQHRRERGIKSGWQFYRWLIEHSFPEGFQVLCYNCNFAKGHYGICPHKAGEDIE